MDAAARSVGVVCILIDVAARMLVVRTLVVVRTLPIVLTLPVVRTLAVAVRTPFVASCTPSAGATRTSSQTAAVVDPQGFVRRSLLSVYWLRLLPIRWLLLS